MEELGLDWSAPEEPAHSGFLQSGSAVPSLETSPVVPWSPLRAHQDVVTRTRHVSILPLCPLSKVDGADEKGYAKLPLVEEAVAVHLCLPMAIGWKTKASHPSKPCRTMSALASRAFATHGQAASALHTIAVQIYQA